MYFNFVVILLLPSPTMALASFFWYSVFLTKCTPTFKLWIRPWTHPIGLYKTTQVG